MFFFVPYLFSKVIKNFHFPPSQKKSRWDEETKAVSSDIVQFINRMTLFSVFEFHCVRYCWVWSCSRCYNKFSLLSLYPFSFCYDPKRMVAITSFLYKTPQQYNTKQIHLMVVDLYFLERKRIRRWKTRFKQETG